ncbi:uncharacterized protein MYCFIDRAFT_180260 [Pseudocercospora fijiensis CIRAD86]|uniref:Uncharacterized protein n=1 Tax=Pseudocercospora fijiensis (strain CIRAD86) TaxID=383855 RepID=M3AIU3_PSEFD|nr:uncharacterized protein MYCFIDRAFT_180260 [Pseudocercospora fijiensis CIRAD86]EME77113.1 hypothetical protein MYCFIDRAFT_180260 [Pseudocercospora fijiensis CIRAD86]
MFSVPPSPTTQHDIFNFWGVFESAEFKYVLLTTYFLLVVHLTPPTKSLKPGKSAAAGVQTHPQLSHHWMGFQSESDRRNERLLCLQYAELPLPCREPAIERIASTGRIKGEAGRRGEDEIAMSSATAQRKCLPRMLTTTEATDKEKDIDNTSRASFAHAKAYPHCAFKELGKASEMEMDMETSIIAKEQKSTNSHVSSSCFLWYNYSANLRLVLSPEVPGQFRKREAAALQTSSFLLLLVPDNIPYMNCSFRLFEDALRDPNGPVNVRHFAIAGLAIPKLCTTCRTKMQHPQQQSIIENTESLRADLQHTTNTRTEPHSPMYVAEEMIITDRTGNEAHYSFLRNDRHDLKSSLVGAMISGSHAPSVPHSLLRNQFANQRHDCGPKSDSTAEHRLPETEPAISSPRFNTDLPYRLESVSLTYRSRGRLISAAREDPGPMRSMFGCGTFSGQAYELSEVIDSGHQDSVYRKINASLPGGRMSACLHACIIDYLIVPHFPVLYPSNSCRIPRSAFRHANNEAELAQYPMPQMAGCIAPHEALVLRSQLSAAGLPLRLCWYKMITISPLDTQRFRELSRLQAQIDQWPALNALPATAIARVKRMMAVRVDGGSTVAQQRHSVLRERNSRHPSRVMMKGGWSESAIVREDMTSIKHQKDRLHDYDRSLQHEKSPYSGYTTDVDVHRNVRLMRFVISSLTKQMGTGDALIINMNLGYRIALWLAEMSELLNQRIRTSIFLLMPSSQAARSCEIHGAVPNNDHGSLSTIEDRLATVSPRNPVQAPEQHPSPTAGSASMPATELLDWALTTRSRVEVLEFVSQAAQVRAEYPGPNFAHAASSLLALRVVHFCYPQQEKILDGVQNLMPASHLPSTSSSPKYRYHKSDSFSRSPKPEV